MSLGVTIHSSLNNYHFHFRLHFHFCGKKVTFLDFSAPGWDWEVQKQIQGPWDIEPDIKLANDHFWKWPWWPWGALEPLKKAPIFGFIDVSRPRRRFWPPKPGLRCLQPSQIFRKFNSDRFPFFKNLKRTSGTKVRSFWRKSWISSKLLKIACWHIGLKDLWMLSALWSSWPRCCSVLVCFCLFVCLLVFLSEKRHARAWHF